MSCSVGHRLGSDLTLIWLWRRLAATAPIGPLPWEPPYAAGAALKKNPKKNKKRKKIYGRKGVIHFSEVLGILDEGLRE